jgi:hypothetical protein
MREIHGSEIADEISYEASKSVLRRFYLEYEVLVDLDCKNLLWVDVARILIGKNIPLSK